MAGFVYFAPQRIAFERPRRRAGDLPVELARLRYDGRVLIATARHHGGGAQV